MNKIITIILLAVIAMSAQTTIRATADTNTESDVIRLPEVYIDTMYFELERVVTSGKVRHHLNLVYLGNDFFGTASNPYLVFNIDGDLLTCDADSATVQSIGGFAIERVYSFFHLSKIEQLANASEVAVTILGKEANAYGYLDDATILAIRLLYMAESTTAFARTGLPEKQIFPVKMIIHKHDSFSAKDPTHK